MSIIEEKGISKTSFIFRLFPEFMHQIMRKIKGRRDYKRKKYYGKVILSDGKGNAKIADMIRKESHFMVARFGDVELRTIVYYMMRKLRLKKRYPQYIRTAICMNAGFFPDDENEIDKFGELMLQSISQCDVLAVWFNLMEGYIFKTFGPADKTFISLDELEPFLYDEPWSKYLEGKRVLVIHPFSESIERQYANKEKLFTNKCVLPSFQLFTIKAVQSIGGKSELYNSWFDALEYMYQEAMKIDFDIAIIGCGAYGFPLAAKIKEHGKTAIHMGGVTQFLFGIKGGRWDSRPEYSKFYNDYWIRPSDLEKPKDADKVENACYW